MKLKKEKVLILRAISVIGTILVSHIAQAAISLDRTRVIFNGDQKSISLNISNNNKQLPYLAQAWIDDENGKKITSPLVVLPPVQRIEPASASQVKIESLNDINRLPQDRESFFYFNLREIPPKSGKPNTLQIALQTRVKLFYRPKGIIPEKMGVPWQEKLTMTKQGGKMIVKNPTPYYVTLINAAESVKALDNQSKQEFTPIMIPPFGEKDLGISAGILGAHPVLSYINDYGGRPTLTFQCQSTHCQVISENKF
ncbi:fimbria/pilus periplasmic chaperone [Providencia rustigianii]|uniref:fimbria/pilus periplasmic chaperone n=1 Tax=Providencia rustigianii TaxID=158850 RepID=UPI000F701F54|nr:fimbria/pilus periplasmic chaperone [Providencia rustigianii]MTC61462.1 fimbria/pilus periplasmic chaperone [Providencia rustigianii]VEH56756.1 Chaperone protein papD precursor [Providencia rustigianii]